MKVLFVTIFLFLLNTDCVCQYIGDYQPLEFDELHPLWIHVSTDSTIIGYNIPDPRDPHVGFDGYSHVFPNVDITNNLLIQEGFLYRISRTLYDVDISGGLIEKIDLESGNNIWLQRFDLRNNTYREFLKKAFIADNKLKLYTYRVTTPDMEFPFPLVLFGKAEGLLMLREYDLQTGALLHFKENPDMAPETKVLTTDLDMSVQLNTIDQNSIEVRHHFLKDTSGAYIVIDTIGINGQYLNSSDTLFSSYMDVNWDQTYWSSDHVMTKDEEGRFYWIDFCSPGGTSTDSPQAQLIIEVGGSTSKIPLQAYNPGGIVKYWKVVDVTDSLIMINAIRHDFTNDFIILNHSGQLIKLIHSEKESHDAIPVMDEKGHFILPEYGGIQNGKHQLEFYQPMGNHLELISSFSIADPDYLMLPVYMEKLENGNYLLYGMHTKAISSTQVEGRFMTDILLTPQMIGLEPVSIAPEIIVKPAFKIWPNPAGAYLHLDFEIPVTGQVFIFDSNGRLVFHQSLHSTLAENLNLHELPSGQYFIQFQDQGDASRSSSIPFFKR